MWSRAVEFSAPGGRVGTHYMGWQACVSQRYEKFLRPVIVAPGMPSFRSRLPAIPAFAAAGTGVAERKLITRAMFQGETGVAVALGLKVGGGDARGIGAFSPPLAPSRSTRIYDARLNIGSPPSLGKAPPREAGGDGRGRAGFPRRNSARIFQHSPLRSCPDQR
jgi:hypothetical protein